MCRLPRRPERGHPSRQGRLQGSSPTSMDPRAQRAEAGIHGGILDAPLAAPSLFLHFSVLSLELRWRKGSAESAPPSFSGSPAALCYPVPLADLTRSVLKTFVWSVFF